MITYACEFIKSMNFRLTFRKCTLLVTGVCRYTAPLRQLKPNRTACLCLLSVGNTRRISEKFFTNSSDSPVERFILLRDALPAVSAIKQRRRERSAA